MPTVISYDVSGQQTAVKEAALEGRFNDCVKDSSGAWKKLPDTTLVFNNTDVAAVMKHFKAIVAKVAAKKQQPITVEKLFGTLFTTNDIESDEDCKGPKSNAEK